MSWFTDWQEQAKKTLEKAVQQVDRVLDIHEDKGVYSISVLSPLIPHVLHIPCQHISKAI